MFLRHTDYAVRPGQLTKRCGTYKLTLPVIRFTIIGLIKDETGREKNKEKKKVKKKKVWWGKGGGGGE